MRTLRALTLGVLLVLVPALLGAGTTALASDPDAMEPTFASPVVSPVPTVPGGPDLGRIGGSNRYAMSANISRYRFTPGSANTVYLTRGDVFFDAMVGGALTDGPLLLVPSCAGVPASVATEIQRLDPTQVVALGGTTSVCDATLTEAAGERATDRLNGADRFETAALIAQRAFPQGSSRVYLAVGDTVPDAVVAGTLTDGPVLLTAPDRTSVPASTSATIEALEAEQVIALGGPASVPDAVLATAADGLPTERISGSNRYATSVAIAKHAHPGSHQRVFLARGDGTSFPDAVASGVLVDGPVLLTPGTCTWAPGAISNHLKAQQPTELIALGGPSTLCDATLRQVALKVSPRVAPDCDVVACVALTFDDGPGPRTAELLDLLAEEQVPVTLFQTGRSIEGDPATSRRSAMEGHQIGNHTYHHPDLRTLTRAQQQAEIDQMVAEADSAGVTTVDTMRPPYGYFNSDTRRLGVPVIKWSVNPKDWAGGSSTQIRDFILANVSPGAIVIQHDVVSNSIDAMPSIIDGLRDRGYHFVTAHELLGPLGPGDLAYSQHDIRRWTGSATDLASVDDGVVDLAPYLGGELLSREP